MHFWESVFHVCRKTVNYFASPAFVVLSLQNNLTNTIVHHRHLDIGSKHNLSSAICNKFFDAYKHFAIPVRLFKLRHRGREKMTRVCRLIPNFAGGMEAGALWRLCASSRLANLRSVFHSLWLRLSKCQHFQENVNETGKAVNDVRKTVCLSSKTTVNHIRK